VAVKLKADMEMQHPIADSDLLELMVARLAQADCVSLGYLLTDFPATKAQAWALQTRGQLISHFFYLPTDDKDGNMSLVTQELLACYTQRTLKLAPAVDTAAATMYAHVCSMSVSKGPFIPRVVLAGAPGAGGRCQAQQLANKYALIPVDGHVLARQAVASKSKVGMAIKSFVEDGQEVPDDLLAGLVDARLSQLDCQRRGWALTNFPRSLRQAELLRAAGHGVNRAVFLDVTSENAVARICGRRTDPVTGGRFHLQKNMPTNESILDRLVQHPEETEAKIREAHTNYQADLRSELVDYYATGVPVDANVDASAVFDFIDACIIKPHVEGPSIL
jgi:adenylate kinase